MNRGGKFQRIISKSNDLMATHKYNPKYWHRNVLKRFRTPGLYQRGRGSRAWLHRHAHIVAFVEQRVVSHDPVKVNVNAVVEDTAQRFKSNESNPEALRTFLHRIANVMIPLQLHLQSQRSS